MLFAKAKSYLFLLFIFSSCVVDGGDMSSTEAETANTGLTTEEVVEETVLPEKTEKFIDKEKYPISEG